MKYNVTATDVLVFDKGSAGPPVVPQRDLMQTINNITSDLASGNTANLTTKDLNDITDAMTNVLKLRAEVGAKSNRMDSALNKNGDENFNMTDLLSKTEDIDITQKTMEFANMQTVYVASLQTSARVIQPSLMDYLR